MNIYDVVSKIPKPFSKEAVVIDNTTLTLSFLTSKQVSRYQPHFLYDDKDIKSIKTKDDISIIQVINISVDIMLQVFSTDGLKELLIVIGKKTLLVAQAKEDKMQHLHLST